MKTQNCHCYVIVYLSEEHIIRQMLSFDIFCTLLCHQLYMNIMH